MSSVSALAENRSVANPRIITGMYRMKEIPVISPARPPLARTRRAIFDTIICRSNCSKVLDLCCGSGSLGLEALSRGASKVVFVDSSYEVIRNLNDTLSTWNISNAETFVSNAKSFKYSSPFDTVFVDLPFMDKKEELVLDNLIHQKLVDENSIIMVRTEKRHLYDSSNFHTIKEKIEGKSSLKFLKIKSPAN